MGTLRETGRPDENVNRDGESPARVVAIRGVVDVDRLATLVATLLSASGGRVTLWGLATDAGDFDAPSAVERARETLLARGLPADRIRTETSVSESPVHDIVARSGEFDVVVMGEAGATLLSALFGDVPERVAEGTVSPVVIVRARPAVE